MIEAEGDRQGIPYRTLGGLCAPERLPDSFG